MTFEISDRLELDLALRYDEDKRENTTETPAKFLPACTPTRRAFTGQVREDTWSETAAQSHAALQADG